MAKLKSSYELACERVIVPKPKMEILDPDKYDDDPLGRIPDFVECWKHPDGPQEHEIIMLEKDGSNGTESLITQYDALNGKRPDLKETIEPKCNKKWEVKVQESYTAKNYNDECPSVHWYGHFTSYTGFSRMNRAFAFGLSNKGIKVKIDNQKSEVNVNSETAKQLEVMGQANVKDDAPKVFGATVPLSMFHSGKKILYTMMETACTLHPDYVGKLNLFDEIWVPTNFAKNLFQANGIHPPIKVMPLGVDTNRYTPERKKFNFKQDLNGFVFLSVFKWGYRKGHDILLKAFMEEFSASDDVTLLLVSRAEAFNHDPNHIMNDFAGIRNGIDKCDDDLPHIALYDSEISEKDMPSIYGSADAFCLISRGEGFGLPYAESGASGLPVIASNCSGHSDFLNDSNSFLVEPDGYVTAETNGTLNKLAKHCRFYEDQKFPNFGRDAIEQTKKHMRYVFENYNDEPLEKATKLRNDLVENYTWEMAIDRVNRRVIELNEEN